MAVLLVKTAIGEAGQPGRYHDGDVVAVLPDDHVFGRMESLDVWVAEGNTPSSWPGGFAIIELPDLTVEEAQVFLEGNFDIRRAQRVDYRALERRSADGGRDTLRTRLHIKRRFEEVTQHFGLK